MNHDFENYRGAILSFGMHFINRFSVRYPRASSYVCLCTGILVGVIGHRIVISW
jgi:hypothetical protein